MVSVIISLHAYVPVSLWTIEDKLVMSVVYGKNLSVTYCSETSDLVVDRVCLYADVLYSGSMTYAYTNFY